MSDHVPHGEAGSTRGGLVSVYENAVVGRGGPASDNLHLSDAAPRGGARVAGARSVLVDRNNGPHRPSLGEGPKGGAGFCIRKHRTETRPPRPQALLTRERRSRALAAVERVD